MLIYFDPRKQQPPRLGPQGFDGVIFCDGANEISNAVWAKIESHPGVKDAIDRGALSFVEDYPEWDIADEEETILLPADTGPTLADASARLAELKGILHDQGWRAIKAIGDDLGVERHHDGWDSSLLRIIQAEFGEAMAAQVEEIQ